MLRAGKPYFRIIMPNTQTLTKLVDGKDVFEYHVYLKSDGSSGEISNAVLIDSSALEGGYPIHQIDYIAWSLAGFDVQLAFDATTDQPLFYLPAGTERLDLTCKQPIMNLEGAGSTGDVLITTVGFTAATDIGHIILKGRKRRTSQ